MIRFSRGIKRRVSAFLCAVALIFALAGFPVRAHAAAATAAAVGLTAVGYAVTLAAFLNAAGIFPFSDGLESGGFSEWVEGDLAALVGRYNATNPETPITSGTIKAYLSAGTICVTHNAWVALRNFAIWLRDTFSLEDNLVGVQMGTFSNGAVPYLSQTATWEEIYTHGLIFGYYKRGNGSLSDCCLAVVTSGIVATFRGYYNAGTYINAYFTVSDNCQYRYGVENPVGNYSGGNGSANAPGFSQGGPWFIPLEGYTIYPNLQALLDSDVAPAFSGVVADTATLSIPDSLPESAEFGGLQVAELGAGATVDALEDVIEDGVMERQRPLVRPVGVQVQQGVEVDSETGAVTENPVIITVDSVALVSSEFALPVAISTVFPFSIPWDIMRVYQALDAEPVFPEIHAFLYVPYSSVVNPDYVDDKIPFTIGIPEDMKAGFDAFAAKFRAIALLLACIAVTWAMAKFIRW